MAKITQKEATLITFPTLPTSPTKPDLTNKHLVRGKANSILIKTLLKMSYVIGAEERGHRRKKSP